MNLNVNAESKQAKVLAALQDVDKGLTAKQIEARFGGNATATVSELRFKGFPIYANKHTDTKGRTKTFFRLSTPSRKVIAAGYRALANAQYVQRGAQAPFLLYQKVIKNPRLIINYSKNTF